MKDMKYQNKKKGIIYLLISAIFFSFSGIFVKGVEATGADVVFWRAVFGAVFMFAWVLISSDIRQDMRLKFPVLILAGLAVICTTTFLMAFKYTSIANVAIIYAATPLVAGILGWLILSEQFPLKDILLSFLAFLGVGVVMFGSLGTINLLGDFLAVVMAITLGLIIVIFRKFPKTSSGAVNIYSCIVLVIIFSIFASPQTTPMYDIGILAIFALFFIIAYVTLQEGSKVLPPALTSLLSILETPLAPVWAWLFLSELPGLATVLGGLIILIAVFGAIVGSKEKENIL